MANVHGTCLILAGAGLLLRGPPGSGKSDLALRLIEGHGGLLVADDRVELSAQGNVLVAAPPMSLAGLLEIRGVGIERMPHRPHTAVDLVADLVERSAVLRMPQSGRTEILGASLSHVTLHAFDASTPAKLVVVARRLALSRGGRHERTA